LYNFHPCGVKKGLLLKSVVKRPNYKSPAFGINIAVFEEVAFLLATVQSNR
jgi:hypothetical protein